MISKNNIFSCLFLDRDGVINKRNFDGYITKPEYFEFLPGVFDALKVLQTCFNHIFIVTNQQGVAKNIMSLDSLNDINKFMIDNFLVHSIKIDEVYCCIHHEKDSCECRKPKIGFFEDANKKYNIDKENSFMVGDTISDMEFGRKAGIKTVLITENICVFHSNMQLIDYHNNSLKDFAENLITKKNIYL